MQNKSLISQVLIEEDVVKNNGGLDKNILKEAIATEDHQFSKQMTGDELLEALLKD